MRLLLFHTSHRYILLYKQDAGYNLGNRESLRQLYKPYNMYMRGASLACSKYRNDLIRIKTASMTLGNGQGYV